MWVAVGKSLSANRCMSPNQMGLRVEWRTKEPDHSLSSLKGHSLYANEHHKPSRNDQICIRIAETDDDKNKPPKYLFIVLDTYGHLCAESVPDINTLDFNVSEGEGCADAGNGKTFDWHYGYKVNQDTLICEDPSPNMWFLESWRNDDMKDDEKIEFDVEDDEKIEFDDYDANMMKLIWGDKEISFLVSGDYSEKIKINENPFNLSVPPDYHIVWKNLVDEGIPQKIFSFHIQKTHCRFLQWLRKNC